uniref:Phosphoribosyltransferase n=1 Tax=Candidatus Desulfatibia profunda TaxID=2841695 RepID=A0A8J6NQ45_9BACT|nr:phosphoribosyltransferase [Candidatus Desulfatibia profunda]
MISLRTRKYTNFILNFENHQRVIDWKIQSKKETKGLPADIYLELSQTVSKYFAGFDILTVPAPSFHKYSNYPVWEIAKDLSLNIGIELIKLFPNPSGKTKMHTFSSAGKEVQDVKCDPGKFVLILDDIYTTGHTMRVTCEAIIRKGSFPCGLAIA